MRSVFMNELIYANKNGTRFGKPRSDLGACYTVGRRRWVEQRGVFHGNPLKKGKKRKPVWLNR